MENNSNFEEMANVAMQIILHAGNARNSLKESVDFIKQEEFEKARSKITQAKKDLTLAHHSQTKIMQEEINGKEVKHSILFIHAQDTLMTIFSEEIMTSNLLDLFENLHEKLNKQKEIN